MRLDDTLAAEEGLAANDKEGLGADGGGWTRLAPAPPAPPTAVTAPWGGFTITRHASTAEPDVAVPPPPAPRTPPISPSDRWVMPKPEPVCISTSLPRAPHPTYQPKRQLLLARALLHHNPSPPVSRYPELSNISMSRALLYVLYRAPLYLDQPS